MSQKNAVVDETNNSSTKIANAALASAGLAVACAGDFEKANLLIAAAPIATMAGNIAQFINEARYRNINRSARRVKEQVEKESISVDPAQMDDIFRQAIDAISDAETDQKRRLIEEIILNSARQQNRLAVSAMAMKAMALIAKMPPGAAAVFAGVAALQRESGLTYPKVISASEVVAYCGVPYFMLYEAVDYLVTEPALISIEIELFDIGEDEPDSCIESVKLTPIGNWLAEWICENPACESAAE